MLKKKVHMDLRLKQTHGFDVEDLIAVSYFIHDFLDIRLLDDGSESESLHVLLELTYSRTFFCIFDFSSEDFKKTCLQMESEDNVFPLSRA